MCRWQVEISQVLVKVLDIPIHLVADVWVDLGRWSISDVAAVWEDSRDDSGDQLVGLLDDSMVEEPVGEGWVVDDSLGAGCPGVRVVWADELSQLWPLEVCCTVGEEDGG